MKSDRFRSLNHKVFIYIVVTAFLLLAMAALVSFVFQYERSKINTRTMLNQLLDTVEDTVSVAVYSKNEQIASDVIKGLLKNDIVHYVSILSTDSFVLEESKESDSINSMDHISRPVYSLFDSDEVIGSITIQPNAQYSLTEAKYESISNMISSFVLICVTALVILWVMQKLITKPLTFVSDTLHEINSGEKQRIPALSSNKDDELGRLRADINVLLSTLEEKFNSEYELRKSIEAMEMVLRHKYNSSSAGLFSLDLEGNLLSSNGTLREMLHISDTGSLETRKVCPFSGFVRDHNKFISLLSNALTSRQLVSDDFLLARKDPSSAVWVHCLLSRITAADGGTSFEGVLFDVTSRVEAERAIQHEAMHDSLTGLLNRKAARALFENPHNKNNSCFVIVDLDGFKQVNDNHGHLAGDQVLKIISNRLVNCVRSSDVVCRYGGDEFLIIVFDYRLEEIGSEIAGKIVTSIRKPMLLDNDVIIKVGVSVGIAAVRPGNTCDFEGMIKEADAAMYEVKRRGKNGYCIINERNEMELTNSGDVNAVA